MLPDDNRCHFAILTIYVFIAIESIMVESQTESVVERIIWLRDHLWHGNQAEMAKATDVPPGTLSNIVRGNRPAGPRVIEKIAKYPGVNASWLRSGEGPALPDSARVVAPDGITVPVAIGLLPGSPGDHLTHLTTRREQVPAMYCRASVYAIEAASAFDAEALIVNRFSPKDLLVVDTDPGNWKSTSLSLDNRLCVVERAGYELTLCQVQVSKLVKGTAQLWANTGELLDSGQAFPSSTKRERWILPEGSLSEVSEKAPEVTEISASQIRGLAVCMIRSL